MAVRTALRVRVPHVHGTLLHVIEVLAQARVRVDALAALADGADTIIELLPMNSEQAEQALQQAGLEVEAVRVATTWVPNEPNQLAQAAQAVVGAGLTIDGFYVITTDPIRGLQVAIQCADADRADQLLWALKY